MNRLQTQHSIKRNTHTHGILDGEKEHDCLHLNLMVDMIDGKEYLPRMRIIVDIDKEIARDIAKDFMTGGVLDAANGVLTFFFGPTFEVITKLAGPNGQILGLDGFKLTARDAIIPLLAD